ncbi:MULTISPECIES: flagellar protein FlaG [Pelosinus]|uniref:Flagellar protein FlaG protein n=1 Tax=Pelosinus fermentans B4 TaxID=1149862 RepID=I9LK66_9FIRM|nr:MULTISPECIES: flagellar protein FlaG [Pelosinus]EIW20914.1 flagellar protein FlaG protein [Pelosinus fermentans B4]EIW27219.1 flagellin [Pelosinus fermentans A11]
MNIDRVNSLGTMQAVENREIKIEENKTKNVETVDLPQLGKAIDKLNEKAKEENYAVQFAVYKDTNRIIVQVVDKINNQVISTYPPKQILEMARMVDAEFKVLDKKI